MTDSVRIDKYLSILEAFFKARGEAPELEAELAELEAAMSADELYEAFETLGLIDDELLAEPELQGKSKAEIVEYAKQRFSEFTRELNAAVAQLSETLQGVNETMLEVEARLDGLDVEVEKIGGEIRDFRDRARLLALDSPSKGLH